jgi:hypothetical protein
MNLQLPVHEPFFLPSVFSGCSHLGYCKAVEVLSSLLYQWRTWSIQPGESDFLDDPSRFVVPSFYVSPKGFLDRFGMLSIIGKFKILWTAI